MDLTTKLSSIPGIGFYTVKKLERLNIATVQDLIYHFPFRYDDFANTSSTLDAKVGEKITLQGEIWSIKNIRTRYGKFLTEAIFNDGISPINLTWFNQSWLTKQIKTGDRLQISGKLTKYKNKLSIIMPIWEKSSEGQVQSYCTSNVENVLVPVYPETEGLTSRWIRNKIDQLLQSSVIEDFLPDFLKQDLLPLSAAIHNIHFPKSWEDVRLAQQRLGFDELFLIQLATIQTRMLWQEKTVVKPWKTAESLLKPFIDSLPYQLTNAQNRVIAEIVQNLKLSSPMNRLIQGEVGSGKTVVAAAAMYLAHLNGFKSLLMAPTEVLAWQHYDNIKNLLEPFGISVGIYTGSKKFDKGKSLIPPNVIIGTHALISSNFKPERVGLVVIDEQHRFGVAQRAMLRLKGNTPHLLTMTATPIPRTVALTLYGDLDLSVIDELPKNRPIIKTYVVPEKKRQDAYKFIEKKVGQGDQAYIITPLIDESETLTTARAATIEFEKLKKIFPKLKLGLLHGRLKTKEKETVLEQFRQGKIQVLVSTTVVEVGVDIPNATIMVIEGAERFGLAQLHQLRGRIGRGTKESYCLLFTESQEAQHRSRLKHMEKTFDGIKLAELDLKIRGSGTIYGMSQHGRVDLRVASFADIELIEKAKKAAVQILQDNLYLDKHPQLKAKLQSISARAVPD